MNQSSEVSLDARKPETRPTIVWYRRPPVQRRLRILARLASMGPREVLHRVSRRAGKLSARMRAATPAPVALPAALLDRPTEYLTSAGRGRGFFDLAERDALAGLARRIAPADVARTLREADAILAEGVTLLAHAFRPADPAFDWHADPERGRLWPLVALDDNDAVRGVEADVKLVWEVNRHQYLVTLARATTYAGDPRYARACVAILRSWIAANPPGLGVNWSSNLEVAIRATSWMWVLHFLVGTPALQDEDLRLVLEALAAHHDHLVRHLSTYTDVTNHLLGESAALALLSLWLPELPESGRCYDLGMGTLAREVPLQVAEDGISREQATSYQRFILDWILQVIALALRNDRPVPPALLARTRAMLEAVNALVGAGGRAPRIGDSDEARGIPFFTDDFWNFDEVLALGMGIVGGAHRVDPSIAYESAVWLRVPGAAGTAAPAPAAPRSRVLAEGGYAILHALDPAAPGRVVFDCGPLGLTPHASHGHGDLLSVLIDVGYEELLVDSGTYAYWDTAGRRDAFRATRAHNTVEIDGYDQADAFDPFKWMNFPPHGLSAAAFTEHVSYVEAWHDGYRRLRPGVRHRRGVLGLVGGWLIVDWIEGAGRHRMVRRFHAPPGVRVALLDGTSVRLSSPTERAHLEIRDVAGPREQQRAPGVTPSPYSERYGRIAEGSAVSFDETIDAPAMRVTICGPTTGAGPGLALQRVDGDRRDAGLTLELRTAMGRLVEVDLRPPLGSAAADTVVVRFDDGSPPFRGANDSANAQFAASSR